MNSPTCRTEQLPATAGWPADWCSTVEYSNFCRKEKKKKMHPIHTPPCSLWCFWHLMPVILCYQYSVRSHFGHWVSIHYGAWEAETFYFWVFHCDLDVIFSISVRLTWLCSCCLLYCISHSCGTWKICETNSDQLSSDKVIYLCK